MTDLQPGELVQVTKLSNPYAGDVTAIAEGQKLFSRFGCAGCHAGGGGGMGPPLIDKTWIYGSDASNIFATIVEGRPNGMPSFAGKVSSQQVWQLVSFVRAIGGLEGKAPTDTDANTLQESASANLESAPASLQDYYKAVSQ